MKKFLTNRVVFSTAILTFYTFLVEMIVRIFTKGSFTEFSVIRIFISSLIVSLIWSFIGHFFNKATHRVLNIIYVLFIGIYEFVEFGLYNYLGFFMGVGNAEQGTKVMSYIMDFMKSLKPEYWLILLPLLIFLVYYIFFDKKVLKNKTRNTTLTMIQKVYIEVVTVAIVALLSGFYYLTIRSDVFKNELQTDSNYSLWLYPENSNLTVNNFGVLMFGFTDLKSIVLHIDAEDAYNIQAELEKHKNDKNKKPVEIDKKREIDDTAWNKLQENTTDSTFKTLNTYFMNREITQKNDYTGIFEGKNLIIILMESVNETPIFNKEEFPTIYKMYNEGISFRNNYSPRNDCSTGNNEFTVLSSLFTINNTCTANVYSGNTYFQGAFNIFNNAGYKTTSYHDYTQKYYYRNKIHKSLGSTKFYGVTDLGMSYDEKYEEWPSDVDMFKSAQKYYMNEDKFMTYFATVSTHQTYNVPSTLGDLYRSEFEAKGYSTTLSRYLSKMKTLDKALEELLNELKEAGKLEDTVIALFGDHFPYGLTDNQINEYLTKNNAGYTIFRNSTNDKLVDRNPMIIYNSGMEPLQVYDYTSILDLLPTLFNMFNVEYDPRLYFGTDIFSDSHASRVVFADGSWASELGYYHAPRSKMTYLDGVTPLTNEELRDINQEISTRQKMSTAAIKSDYFKYLGEGLEKYKVVKDPEPTTEEVPQEG